MIFPLNLRLFPYWHSIWLMFTLTAIYWSLAQQKLSKERLHMLMCYYLHPHKTYTDYKLENIGLINTDQQMCMLMWYIEKIRFSASFSQNQHVDHHFEECLRGHLKHIRKALFLYSALVFCESSKDNNTIKFKISILHWIWQSNNNYLTV